MSDVHTVHVRVNDAATGQPTPVRIRFSRPPTSEYFAPLGRLFDIPTGPNQAVGGNLALPSLPFDHGKFAYIDGTCEINLPADPIAVDIRKGPEYRPICRTQALGPGKMALRFDLQRWIDMRQEGWYSGDIQAHFLTPHAGLLEGAAEDLAVVNLLALEVPLLLDQPSPRIISNILAFSGQQPSLQIPGHVVAVNTLNQAGLLGTLALLHCHRPIFPLSIAGGSVPVIDWTMADWCDQCHRKNGLVVWSAFGTHWSGDHEEGYSGEALADLILGKIDAIGIKRLDGPSTPQIDEWQRFLSCGFRVPLVAGSGKVSNAQALGHVRTYAKLQPGEEFTYQAWINAVRAGRTFVTNGPLLTLTVNGSDPGAAIDLPPAERKVSIRAEARCWNRFDRLELLHNGSVLVGIEASGSPCSALLEGSVELPGSGWLAARCWGQTRLDDSGKESGIAAHTSAIHVTLDSKPPSPDSISLALLLDRIDKMLHWVEHGPRFKSNKIREDLVGIFQTARARLVQQAGGGRPDVGGSAR